jgi:phosphoglycolate phosphatase-like HAD superfamily hydrolase
MTDEPRPSSSLGSPPPAQAETAECNGLRPTVKHIVWDWNGTLLDDNDAMLAAVNAVCAHFGHEPISLDHWREVFSRPLVPCYERLLGRSLTAADWDVLDLLYHQTYRDWLGTTRLAPGVPSELLRWAAAGGSQSLLSMWHHHELVPLVEEHRLTSLFMRVDGLRTTHGGGSKSGHLAAHLAAQHLDPATVLVIGDVLDDATAAAAVGTQCVLLATGVMPERKLRATGMPVASTVADAIRIATTERHRFSASTDAGKGLGH